jgi:hypothetical protein
MDRVDVNRAVVVEYLVTEWTDNWYVRECVTERDRLAGVMMLDYFDTDAVKRAREALSTDGVVGLWIAPGQPYEHMWKHAPADAVAHPPWLRETVDDAKFWGVVADTDSVVTVSVGPDYLD